MPESVQAVLDDPAPVAAAAAFSDVASLVDELRARPASVLVVGNGELADVTLPPDVPESLAPIAAVVRGAQ